MKALKIYGKDWKKLLEAVGTRNDGQVRSHAQKFFNKLEKKSCVHKHGKELFELLQPNLRCMKKQDRRVLKMRKHDELVPKPAFGLNFTEFQARFAVPHSKMVFSIKRKEEARTNDYSVQKL